MNEGKLPNLTFAILDYNRPKESELCVNSIKAHCRFPHQVVYVSNGGNQDHALQFYTQGLVHHLVLNRENLGCGIATRQAFQASLSEWVIYVQSDQYMARQLDQIEFDSMVGYLIGRPTVFCIDLAGNQGNGAFSERAALINRTRYLSIPKMEDIIGGPGPWANHRWGEKHVQDHIAQNALNIVTVPTLFANNGKWSQRSYPCGGETRHSTDEKRLFILKPLKRRYDDFPNLRLSDSEWNKVLAGTWENGTIPEADRTHSFVYWPE